jgi:hypothetical protein
MSPLTSLDNTLLNRVYIPLSHIAGKRWGSTAGSLARGCIPPMAVFHLIRVVTLALYPPESSITSTVALVAFGLLIAAALWLQAGWADSIPNPYSLEPPTIRYAVLLLTIVFIPFSYGWGALHDIAATVDDLTFLSYIYFRAVPAPPPKKRRAPSRWFALMEKTA